MQNSTNTTDSHRDGDDQVPTYIDDALTNFQATNFASLDELRAHYYPLVRMLRREGNDDRKDPDSASDDASHLRDPNARPLSRRVVHQSFKTLFTVYAQGRTWFARGMADNQSGRTFCFDDLQRERIDPPPERDEPHPAFMRDEYADVLLDHVRSTCALEGQPEEGPARSCWALQSLWRLRECYLQWIEDSSFAKPDPTQRTVTQDWVRAARSLMHFPRGDTTRAPLISVPCEGKWQVEAVPIIPMGFDVATYSMASILRERRMLADSPVHPMPPKVPLSAHAQLARRLHQINMEDRAWFRTQFTHQMYERLNIAETHLKKLTSELQERQQRTNHLEAQLRAVRGAWKHPAAGVGA